MRRWIGLAIMLLALAGLPLLITGCAQALAGLIVKAPNHGKSLEQLNAPSLAEFGREPERRFRVDVGPPEASLAIRVLEPAAEPLLGVRVTPKDHRSYRFNLVYAASDQVVSGPPKPAGTIIILHGLRGQKDTLPAMWARMLAGAGYRAVLVDLRGHGQSTGDWLTYGVLEARDLSQLIDVLQRRGLADDRLGVMGISYGGATAIQLAGLDPRIEVVVAVAPFATMREAVPDFGRAALGPLAWAIPSPVINMAVNRTEALTGIQPELASPVRAIASTSAAVLLIHGREDRHVPLSHSRLLMDRMNGPGRLLVMPDDTHMTLAARPQPTLIDMRDATVRWFDTWLHEDPPSADQRLLGTADRRPDQISAEQ